MIEVLEAIVGQVSAATDLDQAASIIVRRVQEVVEADRCSVYLFQERRNEYVLISSSRPSKQGMGRTGPGPEEGLVALVGERQEPIHLEDTGRHARYHATADPTTEQYGTFLGAPIVQHRKVMGVLVVQRKQERSFDDNVVAFVVTVAAQLAGPISNAVTDGSIKKLLDGRSTETEFVQGIGGAPGIAIGTITAMFSPTSLASLPDRQAADPRGEEQALRAAVASVQQQLEIAGTRLAAALPNEERALFDAYVMLSGSESLVDNTVRRIRAGSWAPGALRDTIQEHMRVFEEMDDPYLRARSNDIRDIGRQILAVLLGNVQETVEYPQRCVLLGDHVTVAQLADVPVDRLAGVVCTKGSSLSHTAILARALGIPAVMGLPHLPAGRLDHREIVVDGYEGRIYIQPSEAVRAEYERLVRQQRQFSLGLGKLRELPAITTDGTRVGLHVNTGLLSDAPAALASGAEGVGLYRTEFAFMVRSSFPGEEEQFSVYRKALLLFSPKPVCMRTLDIGGDKILPYFNVAEDNPSLGWRGIRVTLDHPDLFLTQLRAMLRANAGLNNLCILLPMVISVAEVDEALALLNRAHRELCEEGKPSARPSLGVMIETPAATCLIDSLAKRVDFFSVGTNDLTQHLLAVDRHNPRVASLFESLHPAVLTVLKGVIEKAHRWGRRVSVCGEMAGDPAAAALLLAMGVDTLSMAASDIPRIKKIIRGLSHEQARAFLAQAFELQEGSAIRGRMNDALAELGLHSPSLTSA